MEYQSTLAAIMLYNELLPPDLVVDISKHLVLTSVSVDPLWLADLDCARLGLTASVGWVHSAPWVSHPPRTNGLLGTRPPGNSTSARG